MKKKIINSVLIIVIASLIGMGLLTVSFMLPEASIQSNAKASSIVLTYEGMYPRMIDGIEATKMDNYTDAIMINSASFDYGDYSALKKAGGGITLKLTGAVIPQLIYMNILMIMRHYAI